jgi:transketolase
VVQQKRNFLAENARLLAVKARQEILSMTHNAKTSHVGSALSVVDILSVFYSDEFDSSKSLVNSQYEDVLILSKGHAAAALYSILYLVGTIEKADIDNFCRDGAMLGGHVSHDSIKGVTLSTGSLGHGMPYGAGIALAKRIKNDGGIIVVVISDGECDEGTTWETALIANQFNLSNLIVIIDRNNLQSLGPTETTIALEPLDEKWLSFGWNCEIVNGHDHYQLVDVIERNRKSKKPTCVIANTVKGKGVSFMENSVKWHYKSLNEEEYELALIDVQRSANEE